MGYKIVNGVKYGGSGSLEPVNQRIDEANQKIGELNSNMYTKDNIAIINGKLPSTKDWYQLTLPSGFTSDNCFVLAKVRYNNNFVMATSHFNAVERFEVTFAGSTGLWINVVDTAIFGQDYSIMLIKV